MNENIVFSQSVLLPSGKRREVKVEKVASRYSRYGYAYEITGFEKGKYSSWTLTIVYNFQLTNKQKAIKYAKNLLK